MGFRRADFKIEGDWNGFVEGAFIYSLLMCDERDIDSEALFDAAGGEPEVVEELLELFFDLTGQEVIRLVSAAADGDANAVAEAAHKIVGSSATLGLGGLATDLRELEQRCKQGLPDDMDERIRRIKDHLTFAHDFFEHRIKEGLLK